MPLANVQRRAVRPRYRWSPLSSPQEPPYACMALCLAAPAWSLFSAHAMPPAPPVPRSRSAGETGAAGAPRCVIGPATRDRFVIWCRTEEAQWLVPHTCLHATLPLLSPLPVTTVVVQFPLVHCLVAHPSIPLHSTSLTSRSINFMGARRKTVGLRGGGAGETCTRAGGAEHYWQGPH